MSVHLEKAQSLLDECKGNCSAEQYINIVRSMMAYLRSGFGNKSDFAKKIFERTTQLKEAIGPEHQLSDELTDIRDELTSYINSH